MSVKFGPHLYCESNVEGKEEIVESANEVFEIEDFTCPSQWEKFVARLEQIFREWGLHTSGNANSSGEKPPENLLARKAHVEFNDFMFQVELVKCSQDAVNPSFPTGSHPVQYFFGTPEFVLLSPDLHREKETIGNETRSKMVLSTVTVAMNNTGCQLPIFVQVMEKEKSMFAGVGLSSTVKTNYDMIVLSKKPPHCNHLTGLLGMFKSKISQPYRLDIPSVRVTARCKYALEDFTSLSWSQLPPDVDDERVFQGFKLEDILPFGSCHDPIRSLFLFTTWTDLPEDIITDSEVHTDLDPMEAPSWSVGVKYEDGRMSCLLAEYIAGFVSLVGRNESLKTVLGNVYNDDLAFGGNVDKTTTATAALNRLTGPSYTFSDIIQSGRSATTSGGPIKDAHLSQLLTYLFPDSASSQPIHPYPSQFTGGKPNDEEGEINSSGLENDFKVEMSGIKSCPIGGLLWRLTAALGHAFNALGGIKSFAHLLHEFLLEIRYRWDTGHLIPGLPSGPPDHGYCLLHQKLQMINCCITKKIARERSDAESGSAKVDKTKLAASPSESASCSDDDDEFFECNDEEEDMEITEERTADPNVPEWEVEARGRKERFGKLRLLERDEYIYVPECQDPSPMTEDMLAEQAEIMLQLGTDAEGSAMRAKMQSAALLSDMESFKAANPGSTLADFVRWHSPRDWDDSLGKLSPRMDNDDNVWTQVWKCAKPVPAKRQKRLFDDTKEAEKCLQYLIGLKAGQVADMLAPVLLHASISRTLKEEVALKEIKDGENLIRDSVKKLTLASRLTCPSEVKHYAVENQLAELEDDFNKRVAIIGEVMKLLRVTEVQISRFYSLRTKFPYVRDKTNEFQGDFLKGLFANPSEVPVLGSAKGPIGTSISQMFKEAKCQREMIVEDEQVENLTNIFPAPVSREFLLKVMVGRPYHYSQPTQQRFYCCLQDKEFRVAGAFSVDTQFL